jgi:hypothetical protein
MFFMGILLFFSCSDPISSDTSNDRTQVKIKGNITYNMVWETGNEYVIKGEVIVSENATLTIQKDVHILLTRDSVENKGKLKIEGGIIADGEDKNTIIMFKSDESGNNGWGVEIAETMLHSEFQHCSFHNIPYGLKIIKSNLIVDNCNFINCNKGIIGSKCDSLRVINSRFEDNEYGIDLEISGKSDSSILIMKNMFINCVKFGAEIKINSMVLFSDNTFNNCNIGISSNSTANNKIFYNHFVACEYGIKNLYSSRGEIRRNIFEDNTINIDLYSYSYPVITKNNFLNVSQYILKVNQTSDIIVNAEYNWWGTNKTEDIDLYIYDQIDMGGDVTYGTVDYEPFETAILLDCGPR